MSKTKKTLSNYKLKREIINILHLGNGSIVNADKVFKINNKKSREITLIRLIDSSISSIEKYYNF